MPATVSSTSVPLLLRNRPPPWAVAVPPEAGAVAFTWFRAMVEFLMVAKAADSPPALAVAECPIVFAMAVTAFRETVDAFMVILNGPTTLSASLSPLLAIAVSALRSTVLFEMTTEVRNAVPTRPDADAVPALEIALPELLTIDDREMVMPETNPGSRTTLVR